MIDLSWPDLKQYIVSSKNCHFLPYEAQLEPQNSELIFDFSELPRGTGEIFLRKIGGNGEFIWVTDSEQQSAQVLSKKKQSFLCDLFFDAELKVFRPPTSIGKIAFSGIKIDTNMTDTEHHWKKILRQVGNYKKLYLKNDFLFAKKGATIELDKINSLTTNPANAVQISEGKYVFLTACQILNIDLRSEKITNRESFIPHITVNDLKIQTTTLEKNTNSPESNNIPQLKSELSTVYSPKSEQLTGIRKTSRVVFDSQNFSFLKGIIDSKKLFKIIPSCGLVYLNLKAGANLSFPIPELGLESYILVLSAKKISGNGKVVCDFFQDQKFLYSSTVIFDSLFREKNIFLKSSVEKANQIVFRMPAGSSGEVLISKILILRDFVPIFNSDANKQASLALAANIKQNVLLFDRERKTAQNFSDYSFTQFSVDQKLNHELVFQPIGFRAKQYLDKILSFFPKAKIRDDYFLSQNCFLTSDHPDVTLAEIDFFSPSKRLYLFSWDKRISLSEEQKNKLSHCEEILTSSLENYFWLKRNCLKSKIAYLPRYWPKLKVQSNNDEQYYLAVGKESYWKNILASWPSNAPKVYFLGGNQDFNSQFQSVSELAAYPEVFQKILSSQGLICFSGSQDSSAILNLAFDLGLPILTNNFSLCQIPNFTSRVTVSFEDLFPEEKLQKFLQLPKISPNLNNDAFFASILKLTGKE